MTAQPIIAQLDALLIDHFQAQGADFAARVQDATPRISQESALALAELARSADSLDPAQLADFAFRCGRVYEQLEAQRLIDMEMENIRVGFDQVETQPLQAAQLDRVARFIEARDRLFRKVADFTLKAILIVLGLLTLGLVLGVI